MLVTSIDRNDRPLASLFGEDITVVVFTPNYTPLSGGAVSLHGLAYDLYLLGAPVFLFCDHGAENSPVKCINEDEYALLKKKSRIIGIYPEVFPGNPMQSDYTVFWLLNKPNFFHKNFDGNTSWADRIVYYDFSFVESGMLVNSKLTYPLYSPKIFYDKKSNRSDIGLYLHRARSEYTSQKKLEPMPTYVLTLEANLNPQQLFDLFNKTKFIYSFERSGVLGIAQLCGCPVYYISSPNLLETPEAINGGGASVLDGDTSNYKSLSYLSMKVSGRMLDLWNAWEKTLISEASEWVK